MLVWGKADSETSPKRSLRRKIFKTSCMNWGEVNPNHAYYNGSRTSKVNEDPSWSTSFKTRKTQKTSSALEDFIYIVFVLDRNILSNFVCPHIGRRLLTLKYVDLHGIIPVIIRQDPHGLELNAQYDRHNEVACLMLGSMCPEFQRQLENYSPYDMLLELKSIFKKEARVERTLKRLGYVLPQDISVGLILIGLTNEFPGSVRNYNMHNMGKTIGELPALLIKYEKGLPKKAATPQVLAIQGDYPKQTMGYYFYFLPENKIVVARSERTHRAHGCLCLNVEVEEYSLGDLNEPTNYKAALSDPESDKRLDAMNAQMQSMKDNQVWRLVDLPPDAKTVRSKWIFKKKTDIDGNVQTYKACCVVKGYTQPMGVTINKLSLMLQTLELLGFL
ncbi:zinc finger, CCHC-type containing protein [Tanacetum coccineum]